METLKKENYHFDYEHGITESDVMKVNKIIDMIENSRSTERVQVGDVVQYTNEYGEYFPHAIITKINDDAEICEHGGMYINIYEGEFYHSTSGGSFSHYEMDKFTYIGKTTNTFWTFGHNGACANGGIYFTATVNLWECNDNKEMFSTKTHDKYYLSHRKSDSDYQYFASHNAMSCYAWKTEEEMQAWLRTHRAIVTGKTWGGSVIWTYKEVEHHCSNTEYNALNATEDIFLMNGSIYEVINLPARATKFSAGYDFVSPLTFTLNPGETIKIPTGIRCGMNTDWVLMIYPRSGLGFKYQICLANTIGVVDADYYFSNNEGHIFVKLVNRGDKSVHINLGDAFAQGIFMEYGITEDDRVETSRNGGFGSTDKNK